MLCLRARLFIDALWSTGVKGLTSWLSFVMSHCCHFPIGILGQMWYLIVSIPDLCPLSNFRCNLYTIGNLYFLTESIHN